jgi:hypothetical protein
MPAEPVGGIPREAGVASPPAVASVVCGSRFAVFGRASFPGLRFASTWVETFGPVGAGCSKAILPFQSGSAGLALPWAGT